MTRPWNDPSKDLDKKNGFGEDQFIVLLYQNKIIGTIMDGYDCHRGIMHYPAASPDFHGIGFRKMLVEEVDEKIKQLGWPKVNLLVGSDNDEVRDFYESTDYKNKMMFQFFGRDFFL